MLRVSEWEDVNDREKCVTCWRILDTMDCTISHFTRKLWQILDLLFNGDALIPTGRARLFHKYLLNKQHWYS